MSQATQGNPNISVSGSTKVMPVFSPDYALADEGSFFVATLANTISTAVATTTQALADTNPALGLFNNNPAAGYNQYVRYIKVRVTVVGGSNTSKNYSAIYEKRPDKLSTQGTAFNTPKNANTVFSSLTSGLLAYGGVNIANSANASSYRIGDGQVVGSVETAFDEWIFVFGEYPAKSFIGASALSSRTIPMPPLVLAPGWWYTLGFWGASQAASADTFGWEIGYAERPGGQ